MNKGDTECAAFIHLHHFSKKTPAYLKHVVSVLKTYIRKQLTKFTGESNF